MKGGISTKADNFESEVFRVKQRIRALEREVEILKNANARLLSELCERSVKEEYVSTTR